MTLPTFEDCMIPILRLLESREESSVREMTSLLADTFELTEEERTAMIPSGKSTVLRNRVGWARTYLHKAGLVESPRRGDWRITGAGQKVLGENASGISVKFLKQFAGMQEFLTPKKPAIDAHEVADAGEGSTATPDEALLHAYDELRAALESDILDALKMGSPGFFEQVVIDVLVAMGYGGNREDASEVVGKSGDGGIDGIIKEDQLGLDVIYLQAKR